MREVRRAGDAYPLEVRIKTEGSTTYAYLKGEADVFGWESLTTMADTLMNEIPTPQRVVFDLEELDFACARTIRILADICDRLDADGVLTSVRGMRPVVARVAGLVDVRLPAAYV